MKKSDNSSDSGAETGQPHSPSPSNETTRSYYYDDTTGYEIFEDDEESDGEDGDESVEGTN